MKTDEDERALQVFLGPFSWLRRWIATACGIEPLNYSRNMADAITALNNARLGWSFTTAASV